MKSPTIKILRSPLAILMVGLFCLVAVLPLAILVLLADFSGAAPTSWMELLPPVAGLSLCVALVAGVLLAVRLNGRLRRLTEAAQRIARQDFTTEIPVLGKDEIGDLGRAIKDIVQELGAGMAVQGVLTQMDDAILTKLDVGALVNGALRCLRQVTGAKVVILGLFESETTDNLRIFMQQEGDAGRIESHKFQLDAERKRRISVTQADAGADQAPFPEEFVERLARDFGVRHFYSVPVSRSGRTWGVMVSCHAEATSPSSGKRKLLCGISNRLIAGFSGAERDQKLHSLAYVDPLTGLPNRVAMQSLLVQELDNAQRNGTKAAVLFIDLDRFKQANDTHGHACGDRLLVQAANRIRSNVREDDTVARIGGDEFLVILPGVAEAREAGGVARKLIQSLARRFDIDGNSIYTGASVGIALYPVNGTAAPELLKAADTAMYRAKAEGRSRFAFFEEPMNVESRRRSLLDGELRSALERRELLLHYQPQIDLKTGALCGVEALVRWQHPTRGLLLPRDFIGYAEEIGLIPEIGTWVMTEACLQFKRWREAGVRVPRVAVNVSNGQLPRSNFVQTVRQLVDTVGMPAGSLEIEVTESMLVEGGKPAAEALVQLAADGVLIAIDDFGTGYSSFSYLKTMPARVLKLDMSFLVDARPDNDAGKIVAAIVNMAHALHKEVVAEGVERIEQLKLLKALGCERGQGYLFGRAVPAEQIARTFRRVPDENLPRPDHAGSLSGAVPPVVAPVSVEAGDGGAAVMANTWSPPAPEIAQSATDGAGAPDTPGTTPATEQKLIVGEATDADLSPAGEAAAESTVPDHETASEAAPASADPDGEHDAPVTEGAATLA